ncbi:FadR/GntR family transcriptional regulator [Marinococcus halophilus]|uniref:FadR/GntR family transcriptional regulator n=1 Tax=Marinococcus halophilus TaxID=1371 RepID=UPI0009A5ECD5|nr:FadR/GntR family transcriptional regulator [Marinococcus halophilus]
MPESLYRKKVSTQVLESLQEKIRTGEYAPGDKLPPEITLAKQFGVSRTAIREALNILSISGVITSFQGGGRQVNEVHLVNMLEVLPYSVIDVSEIIDLLEMRMVFEVEAAALAAQRHEKEDEIELLQALNQFQNTLTNRESIGFEADYQFHLVLIRAAKNAFFEQTFINISTVLQNSLQFSLSKNIGKPRKRKEVYQEHEKIYEAFCARDSDTIKTVMKAHLMNVKTKLEEIKSMDE